MHQPISNLLKDFTQLSFSTPRLAAPDAPPEPQAPPEPKRSDPPQFIPGPVKQPTPCPADPDKQLDTCGAKWAI